MADDLEQEVVTPEEEPEEPETPEGDEPEEPEEPADEPEEDLQQIRKDAKAFKDQKARAEKAERELKQLKGGKENKRAPNKDANALSEEDSTRITKAEERAERAEARSLGYTHSEDIEYLRKQAHKNFDGDLIAAAEDEFVQSKLNRMKATRGTRDATPPPNKRGGSATSKKLPDFSKMSNAEFDKWEKENRA
jgi:hypothetical protein